MKPIKISEPSFSNLEIEALASCIGDGWITYGPRTKEFETQFARLCNRTHALATSSGTTGLHLVLAALGLHQGDEVIVPNLTYVATANAVRYCGATPVFTDVNPYTWNVDVDTLRAAVSPRTKGIITVDLLGLSCPMDEIEHFARLCGLWVVTDSCEALGGRYKHDPIGARGTASVFSFYGNKTITTGEGGMVVTNDSALAERMSMLRGQGMDPTRRYFHTLIGFNYRMTDLQGAVGIAQLQGLEKKLEFRRNVFNTYRRIAENTVSRQYDIQCIPDYAQHACWMFAINIINGFNRDQVMRGLAADGIETRPMFIPMNRLPMYSTVQRLPVSERIGKNTIMLPTHEGLSNADQFRIMSRLETYLREAA